ncbi:hypothetical protein QEJ31_15140 [Pigmentibacter sp. JX0631]|uniref:hypothetical protein n=1 Tax=Pigmentibacter sp. JX0631 TaxID=2976982 RepID=UPI0024696CE1|nr:hypothetical protein [Pigmentibacter sp. JX0631]WGL59865.1 hypothetical protein QEJ31_15140 [Pigmentibacter sp. JX0631]
MKIKLIISMCCVFLSSCVVNISDSSKVSEEKKEKKLDEKTVSDECDNGNKTACELDEWIQKNKADKNKKVLEESGIRDRGKK